MTTRAAKSDKIEWAELRLSFLGAGCRRLRIQQRSAVVALLGVANDLRPGILFDGEVVFRRTRGASASSSAEPSPIGDRRLTLKIRFRFEAEGEAGFAGAQPSEK